jgi:hypothetical protein
LVQRFSRPPRVRLHLARPPSYRGNLSPPSLDRVTTSPPPSTTHRRVPRLASHPRTPSPAVAVSTASPPIRGCRRGLHRLASHPRTPSPAVEPPPPLPALPPFPPPVCIQSDTSALLHRSRRTTQIRSAPLPAPHHPPPASLLSLCFSSISTDLLVLD